LELIRKRKRQADLQKPLTSSLVNSFGLMGGRGYMGCEYVEVCESKEQKGIRQVVEAVNSQIKLFKGEDVNFWYP
jgi:glycine/serine hydroxymethyltransferase